ncbi:MAG: hypothetical protein JXB08_01705 [Bacilli bacterium]|nr:hypothetical protein [Bacilli bacterium]MBN2877690.1 hypothetical protein [Bacilli bacterium]
MAFVKKIAADLNWDLNKNTAYGVYKGFQVTLSQNVSYTNSQNNFKLLSIPLEPVSAEAAGMLQNYVVANKKELRFIDFAVEKHMFSARLNEMFKQIKSEHVINILDLLIKEFQELGLTPKTTCVYCNEEESDTFTYINGIKFPAHDRCKQEAIRKHEETKKEIEGEPNGMKSYVAGIIGAVIGVIPYAIGVWFGWYIGLLTIITGFAAYKGFQMGGGHAVKSTKYILSAITLAVVILSNFGIIEFIAIQYGVSFADVLSFQELRDIFYEMLAMSALFGLIGVIAVFVKIKRDEFNTVIE